MGLSADEYFAQRFGKLERDTIPEGIEIPRPPEFNVDAPMSLNKYMNPGLNDYNLWGRYEINAPVPAPFQDGDKQHKGTSIEYDAAPLKEINIPDEIKSSSNPYSETSDAKEMYSPPPPSFFKEGKKEFRPPPPEHTPNPSKRRWESMDREEQQDYYFEKKEAFIDYMDDTFEVRLEQSLFEICEKFVDDYERCTGVATIRKAFTKWSRLRGNMRIMMQCSHQYQRMYNCLGESDNEKNASNLRAQDKRITKNLFRL